MVVGDFGDVMLMWWRANDFCGQFLLYPLVTLQLKYQHYWRIQYLTLLFYFFEYFESNELTNKFLNVFVFFPWISGRSNLNILMCCILFWSTIWFWSSPMALLHRTLCCMPQPSGQANPHLRKGAPLSASARAQCSVPQVPIVPYFSEIGSLIFAVSSL